MARRRGGIVPVDRREVVSQVSKPRLFPLPSLSVVLREFEDRRTFHPLGRALRPALSFPRAAARLVVKPSFRSLSARVGFEVPSRVAVCIRRKQRKEVIHALKLTGKGAGARFRRRNIWSGIVC